MKSFKQRLFHWRFADKSHSMNTTIGLRFSGKSSGALTNLNPTS
jgi:hypothetical protein